MGMFLSPSPLVAPVGNYSQIPNRQYHVEEPLPYLYKIISFEQWQDSGSEILLSEMDSPFIHLATEEQLAGIQKKFWSGKDHMVLKLQVEKLVGRLVYETNVGGTTYYYHLYEGIIPRDAVVEVRLVKT